MSSPDIQLADAITASLNSQEFGLPFVAERLYAADWDHKKELESLQCGVWNEEAEGSPFEREQLQWGFSVGVAFAQRLKQKSRDELDSLMDLVWEVSQHLELITFTIDPALFVNTEVAIPLRFDPNNIRRDKTAEESVLYTGTFASHLSFLFERMT